MKIANQGKTASQTVGTLSEWFRRAEEMGITLDDLQVMIDNPEKRRDVIVHWKGIVPSNISWTRAGAIMGNQIVGIEAAHTLGVSVPRGQLSKYELVPFAEVELEVARDRGMYLVAMPEIDLLSLRKAAGRCFYYRRWYDDQKFAMVKSRRGYHLLGELASSTRKSWLEQQVMIPVSYEVPRLVEMAYLAAATLSRKAFPNFVRCSDVSDGNRCNVGVYEGLVRVQGGDFDSTHFSSLGVAFGQFRPLAT